MAAVNGFCPVILLCLFVSIVPICEAQFFDTSMVLAIVNGMPVRDKLLYLAQTLMDNPSVYQDLEDALVAVLPILEYDQPPGNFMGYILPWALHHLSDLLENDTFKDVMEIVIKELNSHNATEDGFMESGNITLDRDYIVGHLFSALDVIGMLTDIFGLKGVRDFFNYNLTDGHIEMECMKKVLIHLAEQISTSGQISAPGQVSTHKPGVNYSGQMKCFSCQDLSDLSLCESVDRCQDNEICFVERYTSVEGHLHYRSGCKEKQICHQHNQTNGARSTCLQCCENSFCNSNGCGGKGFPPRDSRGPLCLDCAHIKDPNLCDQISLCSSDESCYIEELKWGDDSLYHLGCRSVHQCSFESDDQADSKGAIAVRSVPSCRSCCQDDFCNLNCTRQPQNNQQILVG